MRAPLTSDEVLPRKQETTFDRNLTCQWPNELNGVGANFNVVAINDKLIRKNNTPLKRATGRSPQRIAATMATSLHGDVPDERAG